jgi:hypothetical protein
MIENEWRLVPCTFYCGSGMLLADWPGMSLLVLHLYRMQTLPKK